MFIRNSNQNYIVYLGTYLCKLSSFLVELIKHELDKEQKSL